MGVDTDVYGLNMPDWQRPGTLPTPTPPDISGYGIAPDDPDYGLLYYSDGNNDGTVMVAVGDTAVMIGGELGASAVPGSSRLGYSKEIWIGTDRGRHWEAKSCDVPWAWPQLCAVVVVGSRLLVAVHPGIDSNYDAPDAGLAPVLYYSDDLGTTWYLASSPGTAAPAGSTITTEYNYDVYVAAHPTTFPTGERVGSNWCGCIFGDKFWVFRGGATKPYAPENEALRLTYAAWSIPVNFESLPYDERVFTLNSSTAVTNGQVITLDTVNYDIMQNTINVIPFEDHMLIGFFGLYVAGRDWVPGDYYRVTESDDVLTYTHVPVTDIDDPLNAFYQGVVKCWDQAWIIGGVLGIQTLPLSTGPGIVYPIRPASMKADIWTSRDGYTWYQVTKPTTAYPATNWQNALQRSRNIKGCFFPSIKKLLLGGADCYSAYSDETTDTSPTQRKWLATMFHSDILDWPDDRLDETPWYNFPVGGEPGTSPYAPGMSGDFTETGDLLRCLRIDLTTSTISAGCGFPFVSALQNSSPTALPGQIPDKMLVGDKTGYLNKAMVREAAGLGNPSKYVLWFAATGSTTTDIIVDISTRESFLPNGFLKGLTVRVATVGDVYEERTIVDNTHDTITVSALTSAPAAGTKIWIAPMDCAALLNEARYQFPARLVSLRLNMANYQGDDQPFKVGVRTAAGDRRFGEFDTAPDILQSMTQGQLEAGGGIVGIRQHASRSLTYDIRFTPNGGGDLEIGPIWLNEHVQPGEGGLS